VSQANPEVSFIPFILRDIATKPELMQSDLIHPTAEAQPIILGNIWPTLAPWLLTSR
jgi:acyl-CoA thioesterase-1